jgi:leucyl-tRNA synthetase
MRYNPSKFESKWQKFWQDKKLFQAKDFDQKPKKYFLVEFPYPSGDGLHVGHVRSYTALDILSRQKRMEGFNVLYPIGWDAFGLPTENYALKTGIHPTKVTEKNVKTFKRQLQSLGLSFDWSREINTTDPEYYEWTQWIFLKFFEKGLAYQQEMPINWCPSCKIGLANEEVVDGKCERCGSQTTRKTIKQWMLKITDYADRLIEDLDKVDYLEKIKTQQKNWIGRSEGTEIRFKIKNSSQEIKVFTTRVDTIFGVTALVVAPEHELMKNLESKIQNLEEVKKYIEQSKKKSDLERTDLAKEKTGVEIKGIKVINPLNNEEVSVWVGDYVIASYGGGAVMMVPAHDARDFEFAKKYNLPIKEVIRPLFGKPHGGEQFRKVISAVVRREEDNKFLIMKWKNFNWIDPVVGGLEDNDTDLLKTAEREVLEESGYKAKAIKLLGSEIEMYFYDENKKAWCHRICQPIFLELISDRLEEVKNDEKEKHGAIWMSAEEALKSITHEYHKVGLLRYLNKDSAYTDYGKLINSGEFNSLSSEEAIKKITDWLEKKNLGKKVIQYKLRDWIFSRQHYWGEPIPIIHCEKCGVVAVLEKDLPVKLPYVEKYEPSGTGESPLAKIEKWVKTKCPKCGGSAKRETDTMPNWAGSNWYYLRYLDPKNKKVLADRKKIDYWMSVDWYNGGMEHTTLHLLYSRFVYKFLYDLGIVPQSEPYQKRTAHGMVLAEDGQKMSKSRGNVLNPDEIIKNYGADSLRIYEMFMGPFDQAISWSSQGLVGCFRFLNRVWDLFNDQNKVGQSSKEIKIKLHQLIKKISSDLELMKFNTSISTMMEFINFWSEEKEKLDLEDRQMFLISLAPFVPHFAEEFWQKLGHKKSIFLEKWPVANEKYLTEEEIVFVVQINGKVRDTLKVKNGLSEEEIKKIVQNSEKIKKYLENKTIHKVIFVSNKLINFVIK